MTPIRTLARGGGSAARHLSSTPRTWSWALAALASLTPSLALAASSPTATTKRAAPAAEISTDAFFDATRVWKIHLKLTPDQWTAMEPKGAGGPFGPPGTGGPGAAAPRPFGPATFNAPIFLAQGDTDRDGRLSHDEFTRLGQGWYAAWDTSHAGRLTKETLRSGINKTMVFGGAGGPGGRGPAFGLVAREGRRNGLAGLMGIDFPTVRADLEIEGWTFPSISIRFKGNGTFNQSRASLKRSMKIDLDRGFPSRRFAGMTKLNLHSNVTDASWMNEVLTYRLFREAGVPASRTTYARVYLTVPGKYDAHYLGLYSVVENVDRQFLESRFGTGAGALFKPATPQVLEELGPTWAAFQQAYDPKTRVSEAQQQRLMALCALVSKAGDDELAARLPELVDLDELARFLSVTVWLSHLDSILGMGQNFYLYLHPGTGRLLFIPWDHDHAFGQFNLVGTQEQRETMRIRKPWFGKVRFLERLFALESFRGLYLARMKELNETLARPERFHRQVDELAAVLRPAVAEESALKLARFDKVVAGEAVAPLGMDGSIPDAPPGGGRAPGPATAAGGAPRPGAGGPPFGPPPFLMQPVKPIKAFVVARSRSVSDQLAGTSEGSAVGAFMFGGRGGSEPAGAGDRPGGGFEPAMFLLPVFMGAFDADKDGELSQAEFHQGIEGWFTAWNTDKSGVLSEDQLWAGINKDFARR